MRVRSGSPYDKVRRLADDALEPLDVSVEEQLWICAAALAAARADAQAAAARTPSRPSCADVISELESDLDPGRLAKVIAFPFEAVIAAPARSADEGDPRPLAEVIPLPVSIDAQLRRCDAAIARLQAAVAAQKADN